MKAQLRLNENFPFKAVLVALVGKIKLSPACTQHCLRSLSTPGFSNLPSCSFPGRLGQIIWKYMHSMMVEHDYGLSSTCLADILDQALRHTGPDGRHQSVLQASISLCCCLKIPDAAESLSSDSLFFRFHPKSFIVFDVSVFPFECLNLSQCFSSDTSEFSLLSYLVSFQLSCFLKHWKQVPSNTELRSKCSPGTEKLESLGKVTLGPFLSLQDLPASPFLWQCLWKCFFLTLSPCFCAINSCCPFSRASEITAATLNSCTVWALKQDHFSYS